MRLADALDSYIPSPERAWTAPFLMPVEDVFSISGRGTVVTGRVERGIVKVGEELEIVGIKPTRKRPPAPASKCSANCSTKVKRATTSACCCAAPSVKTSSAAKYWPSRARSSRTHSSPAEDLRPVERRRRPSYPVLQRLSSAVLLPHHGRDRLDRAAEGKEMVMPGDNVSDHGEADQPDRDGRRSALRDPRRRPYRRRRRGCKDYRLILF